MQVIAPGNLTSEVTANNLINLLQSMYVEHGITKNRENLVNDIGNGNVLTWFAQKNNNLVATASLVKQADGAWELGRAVSLERGNGIGKSVILEALKFHLENHPNTPLTAEVRAAAEFEGIPSGQATQKIFFGLVNDILPITPFAVAPLFAHGNPVRNEPFILSGSDVTSGKTITEKTAEVLEGRSQKGIIGKLQVVQTSPFRLAIPNDDGKNVDEITKESENFDGCSLFPIEATDKNMPLIGMMLANPNMVGCGTDRVPGKEGKTVILIATLGFQVNLAPIQVSEILPNDLRLDIKTIGQKFELGVS